MCYVLYHRGMFDCFVLYHLGIFFIRTFRSFLQLHLFVNVSMFLDVILLFLRVQVKKMVQGKYMYCMCTCISLSSLCFLLYTFFFSLLFKHIMYFILSRFIFCYNVECCLPFQIPQYQLINCL